MSEALTVRCECDEPACEQAITLSAAALEGLRHTHELVLAPGHPLDEAHEARRRAAATRDDAKALSAQAAQIRRRAEETRAAFGSQARVLVVNDSITFLRAAAAVVLAADRLRWIGSVVSGEEAIRVIPLLRPSLVLIDVYMPGLNGVETTRIIHKQHPEIIVALISTEPEGLAEIAHSAGATALLNKANLNPRTLDALWLKHQSAD